VLQTNGSIKFNPQVSNLKYLSVYFLNGALRKWLIFDGPMDSMWAENLNTVLDDSRRLFLMSGENCHLPPEMNILFETSDLNNVSPALVRD
jgi:dynein heavy chain, axonemal